MNEQRSGKQNSVEQLLSNLRQHDWSVNWKTADALAEIGQSAVPPLLRALEDPDGYVRNGAAIALGKIGNVDATQALIRALQWRDDRVYEDDEDQEARMSAAAALGKLRSAAACQALMAELEMRASTDLTLASYIVEALGEIGNPEAIALIKRAIASGDFELQKIGSWALTQLGTEGIEALLQIAGNHDQTARPYVIRALGTNIVESATPLLLQILKDPDENKFARCQAAQALGKIGGPPEILPLLLTMLQAPEELVRTGALWGLGALHDSRAYSAIVEQLDNEYHRYTAIMALGEVGDPRACELLIPMLQSGDNSLTFHAATALGKLGCCHALPALIQLRDRMAVSDSPVSGAHRATVEAVIQKLQQREHGSVPGQR
jgi:HEAT repeat protein